MNKAGRQAEEKVPLPPFLAPQKSLEDRWREVKEGYCAAGLNAAAAAAILAAVKAGDVRKDTVRNLAG